MPHPFHDSDADAILRTSDNVDFFVYRVILSKASPVFKDMFALPQPGHVVGERREQNDDLPVISVSEDSSALEWILQACYPMPFPKAPPSLDSLRDILQIADKYQMDVVISRAEGALETFVDAEPIRTFVLSSHYKLERIARLAAARSLRLPMTQIILANIPEFRTAPVALLQQLLQYHAECTKAVLALIVSCRWISNPTTWVWYRCIKCPADHRRSRMASRAEGGACRPRKWWTDYMQDIAASLCLDEGLDQSQIVWKPPPPQVQSCSMCSSESMSDIIRFSRVFQEEVDRAIAAVKLDLT